MKQNKRKTLALALALALILALFVGTLAACNGTDKNKDDDKGGDDTNAVFSLKQYNALFGYLYSFVESYDGEASMVLYYYSSDAIEQIKTRALGNDSIEAVTDVMDLEDGLAMAEIYVYGEYDEDTDEYNQEKKVFLTYASSKDEAADALEAAILEEDFDMFEEGEGYKSTSGNIAILESERGLFANEIAKASFPSSVSSTRKNALKQAYEMMTAFAAGSEFFIGGEEESLESFCEPEHGNQEDCFGYYKVSPDELPEWQQDWEDERGLYTDDSYFDATRESGYAFRYVSDKPGFRYENVGDPEQNQIRITDYISTENVVENLTIPAKIDGKKVVDVTLSPYHLVIKHITVSEGIYYAYIDNYFAPYDSTVSINLPSSVTSARLNCFGLETIYYAGNRADFEATFENAGGYENVNSWCHVQKVWDNLTHQYVYVDITIDVVCKDGTLTYPKQTA